MKKVFFSVFAVFVLFIAACTSKSEKTTGQSYLELQVGSKDEGSLTVTNLKVIKKEWEKRVREESRSVTLTNFRIIKGTTSGEAVHPYYMLIANSADGKLKIASLLVSKGDGLYFDTYEDEGHTMFYSSIMCEGNCEDGCDPQVTFSNGRKFLNCSQCPDCVKKEAEMR